MTDQTKSLANPLARIVGAAKATLPANTGATEAAARRAARGNVRVVLADVSESMLELAGSRSKYAILQEAVAGVAGSAEIVSFSSFAADAPAGKLPPPSGSTALHRAIEHILHRDPTHVLVISDGHPDNPATALAAADKLDAQIDIIYCGPDSDRQGLAFMQRLARKGGKAHHVNLRKDANRAIATTKALMLPSK